MQFVGWLLGRGRSHVGLNDDCCALEYDLLVVVVLVFVLLLLLYGVDVDYGRHVGCSE